MPETLRTLDVTPATGELVKPAELVDIAGAEGLSLYAAKVYNVLLRHAFGPGMESPGQSFSIRAADLHILHPSNTRIKATLKELVGTVVEARTSNGREQIFTLLGGADFKPSEWPSGIINYSFDIRLVELLRNSSIFAKLRLQVVFRFSSKYGLALYEAICRRINKDTCVEEFSLDEFRELLRVERGKLTGFAQLHQKAIQPAIVEVNGLADFEVHLRPRKAGKKVVGVTVGWSWKSQADRHAAQQELDRPRVGRAARLRDKAEQVIA